MCIRDRYTHLGKSKFNRDDYIALDTAADITVLQNSSRLLFKHFNPSHKACAADDRELDVTASGNFFLKFPTFSHYFDAVVAPALKMDLLSLDQLDKAGNASRPYKPPAD